MEYIITGIANVAVFIIEAIVSFFVNSIIAPINGDMNLFFAYFGAIKDYYVWIQSIGILIAVGIFVFQCIKSMFYHYSASQTDSVPIMLIKLVISVGFIVSAVSFTNWIIQIGTFPTKSAGLFDSSTFDVGSIIDAIATHAKTSADVFGQKVSSGETTFLKEGSSILVSAASGIGLLAALVVVIALCIIGWKLIKLLLEILERYVLLNIVLLMSPLAVGTAISRSTVSIFRKYLEMLVSTFLLLFLNLLMLRIILSAMVLAFSEETMNYTFSNGSSTNIILSVFIISALITVATSMDQHLSKLIVTGTIGKQMGIGGFLAAQVAGGAIRGAMRGSGRGGSNATSSPLGGKDKGSKTGAFDISRINDKGKPVTNASLGQINDKGGIKDHANGDFKKLIAGEGTPVIKGKSVTIGDLDKSNRIISEAASDVDKGKYGDIHSALKDNVDHALQKGDVNAATYVAMSAKRQDSSIDFGRITANSMVHGLGDSSGMLNAIDGIAPDLTTSKFEKNGNISCMYKDRDDNDYAKVSFTSTAFVTPQEIQAAVDSGQEVYCLPGENDFVAIVDYVNEDHQSIGFSKNSQLKQWEDPIQQFLNMTGDNSDEALPRFE